jgi:hypothetical protein
MSKLISKGVVAEDQTHPHASKRGLAFRLRSESTGLLPCYCTWYLLVSSCYLKYRFDLSTNYSGPGDYKMCACSEGRDYLRQAHVLCALTLEVWSLSWADADRYLQWDLQLSSVLESDVPWSAGEEVVG